MSSINDSTTNSSDIIIIGPFNWIIPLTSIITICIIGGYTLPKNQILGLFVILWWTASVLISLQNTFFHNKVITATWNYDTDWYGFLLMSIWPILIVSCLTGMYTFMPSIRKCILDIPIWALLGIHCNRISGASIFYQYKIGGHLPYYIGLQTAIFDIIVSSTAIPLALWVKRYGLMQQQSSYSIKIHEWIWNWNILGLFDMISAWLMRIMNYYGIGGSTITQPAITILGFHPFALIILFQQTLAISIHLFFITRMKQIIQTNQKLYMKLPMTIRHRG